MRALLSRLSARVVCKNGASDASDSKHTLSTTY
jgi:hypothetical protein